MVIYFSSGIFGALLRYISYTVFIFRWLIQIFQLYLSPRISWSRILGRCPGSALRLAGLDLDSMEENPSTCKVDSKLPGNVFV